MRLHRQEQRPLWRSQLAATHLTSPGEQQAGIQIMPGRHLLDRPARFKRLCNDPQLVVQTPTSALLPAVDDLNLTVRHLCKIDFKGHFKVVTLAIPRPLRARGRSPAFDYPHLS